MNTAPVPNAKSFKEVKTCLRVREANCKKNNKPKRCQFIIAIPFVSTLVSKKFISSRLTKPRFRTALSQ